MKSFVRKFPGGGVGLVAALALGAGGLWYYRTKVPKAGDIVSVDLSKAFPTAGLAGGEATFKVLKVGPGDGVDVAFVPGAGGLVPPPNMMGAVTIPRRAITRIVQHA